MGRKPYVSNVENGEIISIVRKWKNGGAYIPVPKEYAGKLVRVVLE